MTRTGIKSRLLVTALALTGVAITLTAAATDELPDPLPYGTGDTNRADPIPAQALTVTPIGYGSPVFGIIGDANDFIDGENARRSDFFGFSVTDPLPRYVVTARSETFAAASTLYFADEAAGTLSPQQSANVWAPGRQVQYSGTLPRAGTYLIEVSSIGGSHGGYTVSLGNGGTAACDAPGTNSPFVEISPGLTLNCELSANSPITLQSEAGKHYAKGFHFIGNGEIVKLRAASGAFTPVIARIDRGSGQVLESGQGELSGAFTGDVFYVVSTAKPAVTGAFTTDIVAGTTAGGTARAAGTVQWANPGFDYVIEH